MALYHVRLVSEQHGSVEIGESGLPSKFGDYFGSLDCAYDAATQAFSHYALKPMFQDDDFQPVERVEVLRDDELVLTLMHHA